MSPVAVLLIAVGGALFFEGVAWAVFPRGIRDVYSRMMREMDDKALHISGLISVFIGVCLIALALKMLA